MVVQLDIIRVYQCADNMGASNALPALAWLSIIDTDVLVDMARLPCRRALVEISATMNVTDYLSFGEVFGLSDLRLRLFVAYMSQRWPEGVHENYAGEWAERFMHDQEYAASDRDGMRVLRELYHKEAVWICLLR